MEVFVGLVILVLLAAVVLKLGGRGRSENNYELKPALYCVVELDDRSHARRNRRNRDAFLGSLCAGINLRLVRVQARRAYKVEEVRQALLPPEAENQSAN